MDNEIAFAQDLPGSTGAARGSLAAAGPTADEMRQMHRAEESEAEEHRSHS